MEAQFRIAAGLQRARHLYATGRATQKTPYVMHVIQEILLQQLGPRAHDIDQGVSTEDLSAVFCSLPNTKKDEGSYLHAWNDDYWVWAQYYPSGYGLFNVTKKGGRASPGGYAILAPLLRLKGIDYSSLTFYTGEE